MPGLPPFPASSLPWHEPPGHERGLSRYLVGPHLGATQMDLRLSRYPTGGRVSEHAHESAEQGYYFLSGTGVVTSDGDVYEVGPGDVLYVPPGVRHSVRNEAPEDLLFVVVTSPAAGIER